MMGREEEEEKVRCGRAGRRPRGKVVLMIGVGRKERKGREKTRKSGTIKRQGIKMSKKPTGTMRGKEGGSRAFIDGLAQPKREHKDKQMKHTHTHKGRASKAGRHRANFVCPCSFM